MALDPYLNTVKIGPVTMPPQGLSGHAWISITTKVKVDEKKSSGKDGSRLTLQGEDTAECVIDCTINDSRPATMRVLAGVLGELNKLKRVGPQQVSHVNAEAQGVGSMQITEIPDGIKPNGGKITIQIKGKGWSADSATTQGCQLFLLYGSTDKSTSGEVTKWQTFLNSNYDNVDPSLLVPIAVDGIFGTETKNATLEFQTSQAILVDGIVGPQTFGAAAKFGYVIPAPKTCGSVTKTPKKAAETTEEFGPSADEFYAEQARKDAAKAARAAALEEWAKNGTPPNERGEGLPDDFNYDPYAEAMNEGGAP